MKKFLLIICLLPFMAHGQFGKGQLFVGGSLTAQGGEANISGRNDGTDGSGLSRNLGIAPRIGYFLNDKWSVGVTLGYSFAHSTNNYITPYPYGYVNTMNSFNAGIFARRYFAISEKFLVALDGSLRFSRNKNETKSTTFNQATGTITSQSSSIHQFDTYTGIRPVLLFFPAPKWGFEAGMGGISFDHLQDLSGHTSTNTFVFLLSTSFSIGLNYYFSRK